MKKRLAFGTRSGDVWALLVSVGAAVLAWAPPQHTAAQEIPLKGPLAGQPAVRHMRAYREGRLQVQPFVGFTLQDQYSRTALVGGQIAYHPNDWLGIGLWGGLAGAHIDTSLTDAIAREGQTTDRNALSLPSNENFPSQIAKIKYVGALQATFIPLRGKLALFQKIFVDTDFYLFGGVAGVGLEERADVTEPNVCATLPGIGAGAENPCIATQLKRASRTAIAPTFGAGLTLYLSQTFGLAFEWRALPFAWNTSGTDEAGRGGTFPDGVIDSSDRIFHFNHMVTLGLSASLPTRARVSP